jgi:hypothetical protein
VRFGKAELGQYIWAREQVVRELNARFRRYGGDWFDVYGDASGLLELELADPEFANR